MLEQQVNKVQDFEELLPVLKLLRSIKLNEKCDAFIEHEISMESLRLLEEDDLKDLGLEGQQVHDLRYVVHGRSASHQSFVDLLDSWGMSHYTHIMDKEQIDLETAKTMDMKAWKAAGVVKLGDRRILMKNIADAKIKKPKDVGANAKTKSIKKSIKKMVTSDEESDGYD